jgi:hypothetical protein
VLDRRDFRLAFFNEPASPMATGGVYSEPAAEAFRFFRLPTFRLRRLMAHGHALHTRQERASRMRSLGNKSKTRVHSL